MELYLEPPRPERNKVNGRFLPGHKGCNKGKKWAEYMPKEKQHKILKALQESNRPPIGGWNKKAVICVDIESGNFCRFASVVQASAKMKVYKTNIYECCWGKRKTAGGFRWFYESNTEWLKVAKWGK